LPRLLKTKAGGPGQAPPQAASTATSLPATPTQTANAGENPQQPTSAASAPAAPSPTAATPAETTAGPPGETSESSPGASNPVAQPPAPGGSKRRAARGPQGQGMAPSPQSGLTGGTAAQAPGEEASPPSQAAQAPQASAESAEAAKELEELEDRMTPLAARASAVKDSVEHLRRQQESAGYSIRQDISAAVSSMDQYMGKADAALNSRNPGAAKKYMDLAEREIEKLEKFFGR